MRAAKYLCLAAALAACTDRSEPVSPAGPAVRGPASTLSGTAHLIVTGFTTDTHFNRYTSAPSYLVTGDYSYYWNRTNGALDSVTVEGLGSGAAVSMNGGETYVTATIEGVDQALGSVSGDMEAQLQIFTIPSDGYVTLDAHPNEGCRFLWWEDASRNRITGNPLQVTPTSSLQRREAWFLCGERSGV